MVFEGLGDDRNLITWNAVLSVHAQQGDVPAVVDLFIRMRWNWGLPLMGCRSLLFSLHVVILEQTPRLNFGCRGAN
jgi:pentatricopeptide repeat protein